MSRRRLSFVDFARRGNQAGTLRWKSSHLRRSADASARPWSCSCVRVEVLGPAESGPASRPRVSPSMPITQRFSLMRAISATTLSASPSTPLGQGTAAPFRKWVCSKLADVNPAMNLADSCSGHFGTKVPFCTAHS